MKLLAFHWGEIHEVKEKVWGVSFFGCHLAWYKNITEKWGSDVD